MDRRRLLAELNDWVAFCVHRIRKAAEQGGFFQTRVFGDALSDFSVLIRDTNSLTVAAGPQVEELTVRMRAIVTRYGFDVPTSG